MRQLTHAVKRLHRRGSSLLQILCQNIDHIIQCFQRLVKAPCILPISAVKYAMRVFMVYCYSVLHSL